METCIEMEGPHFFALTEEIEYVKVEEEQVQECLASLEQWECRYFIESNKFPLAQGCDFRGTKAVGEPFMHPWACETGLCSVGYRSLWAGYCDGVCQEPIAVGQPCGDDGNELRACADDSHCDPVANRCVYNLDEGEELDRNGEDFRLCGIPMTSIQMDVCTHLRTAGETCLQGEACFNSENFVCNFDASKGPIEVCIEGEFVQLGGECKPRDICEPGLRCSPFERCVVPAAEGESCRRDACEWGLWCEDEVCRRPSLEFCAERAAELAEEGE